MYYHIEQLEKHVRICEYYNLGNDIKSKISALDMGEINVYHKTNLSEK